MLSVKSSHFDELWPFYVVVATDDIKFSFKDCLQTTLESLTSVYFLHTRVWHIGGLNKCWQTTACSLFSLIIFLIHETCLAWPNFCFPKTESLQRISICCHWGDFFKELFLEIVFKDVARNVSLELLYGQEINLVWIILNQSPLFDVKFFT